MELAHSAFQGAKLVPRRLDDDLLLAILLDLPFPSIDGRHGRQDIDAGGQPLIDQRAGQCGAVGFSGNRRQDEDDFRG